eukprot:TRINITY_DN6378_c0_g1_i3.p1 TRINITY_DN6378_c0_g1~~TRINITY_DN6378_c0_g1_i3.p1  ORF type:complete len:658 (-),score=122.44 TRINITY_DN6378_c0_g1_i3:51-2024(-)
MLHRPVVRKLKPSGTVTHPLSLVLSRFYTTAKQVNTLWVGNYMRGLSAFTSRYLRSKVPRNALESIEDSSKYNGYYVKLATQSAEELQQVVKNVESIGLPVHIVKGTPFRESLTERLASLKLSINAKGASNLTEESIYKLFRPYGKLRNVSVDGTKAEVFYKFKYGSVAARNCLHRSQFNGAELDISFLPYNRLQFLIDVFTSPKVTVPLAGVSIASLSYVLLNPVRTYFVYQKVTLESKLNNVANDSIFKEIVMDDIMATIHEQPNDVDIIYSSAGLKLTEIGKELSKGTFSLYIDCNEVVTIEDFVSIIEKTIGYRPSFNALNNIQLALGAVLPKSVIVQDPTEQQLEQLLLALESAIKLKFNIRSNSIITFGNFHKVTALLEKDSSKAQSILDKFSRIVDKWTSNGTATVVITGSDPYLAIDLKQFFSNMSTYALNEYSKEKVKKYIQFKCDMNDDFSDRCYEVFGGNLGHIDYAIKRCKSDPDYIKVLESIIEQETEDMKRKLFGSNIFVSNKPWSNSQAWAILNKFKDENKLPLEETLLSTFVGEEEKLRSFIKAGILTLFVEEDQSYIIPSSKLSLISFRRLLDQDLLTISLKKHFHQAKIDEASGNISSIEESLVKIATISGKGSTMRKQELENALVKAMDTLKNLKDEL